jgi:LysR family glycine cleavage system transcriptional activator
VKRARALAAVRAPVVAGAERRTSWLPPLGALHAFEAAGRHRSFKRAAAELCVTPSAVSRQIKALEGQLGVALFVRDRSQLALTAAGVHYLAVVEQAFAALTAGTAKVRRARGGELVRLTCVQALAANWLLGRLHPFAAAHPEIELQIVATDALVDVASGEADVAIRFGQGGWPGTYSEVLLELDLFPVASPALARQLRTPRDLVRLPWLHLMSYPRAFRDWLAAAGVPDGASPRNLSLNGAELVYRAAAGGLGVAMASSVLVAPYLEDGRLVRPFAHTANIAGAYYLVHRADDAREPAIAALCRFLRELAYAWRASIDAAPA